MREFTSIRRNFSQFQRACSREQHVHFGCELALEKREEVTALGPKIDLPVLPREGEEFLEPEKEGPEAFLIELSFGAVNIRQACLDFRSAFRKSNNLKKSNRSCGSWCLPYQAIWTDTGSLLCKCGELKMLATLY